MFYRIRDGKVYDYANYKYEEDCLSTELCTMREFETNRENYTIENGQIEVIPNLEEKLAQKRKTKFEKEFFNTSLGWIRRKVTMADGSEKEFLADLLLPIKAGLDFGREIQIITYRTPDFNVDMTKEYMQTLQERKTATPEFVEECLIRTVMDFGI